MLVTLNDILPSARNGGYAVGLFNTVDTDMLEAVISASEETRSPVIIGTAEVLLPYGELSLIAPALISAARRATVPVVVHFDHGLTFERTIEALRLGFSSVMFDGSAKKADENVSNTRKIVEIAHAFGASVEGEIGHVGAADGSDKERYTTPEEALEFAGKTGVDALAVSIGTAHGVYKDPPKLDLMRLRQIRAALDTPLVLHGGSGLSENDFHAVVREGIAKINVFTDLCIAGSAAMRDSLEKGLGYTETRSERVAYMKEAVKEKQRLFGCAGKA